MLHLNKAMPFACEALAWTAEEAAALARDRLRGPAGSACTWATSPGAAREPRNQREQHLL